MAKKAKAKKSKKVVKKTIKKVLKKIPVKKSGLKEKFIDILVKAVIISVVAVLVAFVYTGIRKAVGLDKKDAQPAAETTAAAVPEAAPVKKVPLDAKYRHLLNNVKSKEAIPKIHIEEAKALFESGKALFIDARSASEYTQSRIPGSVYIGAGDPPEKIKDKAAELKGKVLVPYCHGAGCHLSDKVAHKLYDEGYRKLVLFFGGWPEWTQANMPVEEYQPPEEFRHLYLAAETVKDVKNITLAEAKFMHDDGKAVFVDVDFAEKYNLVRIQNSINIPIDKLDEMLPRYGNYLSQKPLIVYCHGRGGKSQQAVEKMHAAGYKKILRFVDAIPQWEKSSYPLYRQQPNQGGAR